MNRLTPFLMMITLFAGCKAYGQKQALSYSLMPWLAANGKFGFCDSAGTIKIEAQYDDAGLLQNGFAIVVNKGKYGVVNSQNDKVMPLKFAMAKLVSKDRFLLLVTKKEYNAWWHFWQWRIYPEFNILSGHNGPFLVTKVPKAKWQIRYLPSKKKLFTDRRLDKESVWETEQYWKDDWLPSRLIPSDIKIASAKNVLAINSKLFVRNKKKKIKRRQTRFAAIVNDSTLLLRRSTDYVKANLKGSIISPECFRMVKNIAIITTAGDTILISKTGNLGVGYPIIRDQLYVDKKGDYFFSSSFSKAFPKKVEDYLYKNMEILGKDILAGAVTIMPWVKDYFLVFSGVGEGKGWATFFLHENGAWNNTMPIYNSPKRVFTDGRISFEGTKSRGVLDTNFQFYPMPLQYIQPCSQNENWYMGKDTATGLYGVYDAKKNKWQVPPVFDYLQDEIAPDIAIYSQVLRGVDNRVIKESFGLINLKENKKITPALYDYIQPNGCVFTQDAGAKIHYFINLHTGLEYREKEY